MFYILADRVIRGSPWSLNSTCGIETLLLSAKSRASCPKPGCAMIWKHNKQLNSEGTMCKENYPNYRSINVNHFTTKDDAFHTSFYFHSGKWRPFGFGKLCSIWQSPFLLQIYFYISIGLIWQMKYALWVMMALVDYFLYNWFKQSNTVVGRLRKGKLCALPAASVAPC